jgi:hypothetical protein
LQLSIDKSKGRYSLNRKVMIVAVRDPQDRWRDVLHRLAVLSVRMLVWAKLYSVQDRQWGHIRYNSSGPAGATAEFSNPPVTAS